MRVIIQRVGLVCCWLAIGCFDDGDDPSGDGGAPLDASAPRDAGALTICELPAEPGPCEAAFERWAWNPNASACQRFSYGGCEGNANNFETPDACLQACAAAADSGLPGAACMVGDQVFPSGVAGITDPFSCNMCVCDNGVLSCDDAACPKPCPPGTKPSSQCAGCSTGLGCTIVEFACLPLCTTNADCAEDPSTQCFGDTCQSLCD